MKIAHFAAGRIHPDASKVGSAQLVYHLAKAQREIGLDAGIVVVPAKREHANVHDPALPIQDFGRATWKGFRPPAALARAVRSGDLRPDLAHLHAVFVPEMAAVANLLSAAKVPFVVSSHGSFSPLLLQRSAIAKRIYRHAFALPYLRRAAALHVHAEAEVAHARAFGVETPIVVVEPGVETPPSDASSRGWLDSRAPAAGFRVLFLGRLDPWHKGLDLLLSALALLPRSALADTRLYLVGPEKHRARGQLPRLAARLGIAEHVSFLGAHYARTERYAALASADLLVLTSRYEGFPLVLLEALAVGTPVLVTPGTNATDLVSGHGVGFVADGDPESISRALLRARHDDVARREAGTRGAALATHFSWRRSAERLRNTYGKVLQPC